MDGDKRNTKSANEDLLPIVVKNGMTHICPHSDLRRRLRSGVGKVALLQTVVAGDPAAIDLTAKNCIYDMLEDVRTTLTEASEALKDRIN